MLRKKTGSTLFLKIWQCIALSHSQRNMEWILQLSETERKVLRSIRFSLRQKIQTRLQKNFTGLFSKVDQEAIVRSKTSYDGFG